MPLQLLGELGAFARILTFEMQHVFSDAYGRIL